LSASSPIELQLQKEITELRAQLAEAEATLSAIRTGEVDALVMAGQVYTLQGAETPYRLLVEAMHEGAASLLSDGTVLYANQRLAKLLHAPLHEVIGSSLARFVAPDNRTAFEATLAQGKQDPTSRPVTFQCPDGTRLPVQLSLSSLDVSGAHAICAVVTDLTEHRRSETELARYREHLEELVRQRGSELAAANVQLRAEVEERTKAAEELRISNRELERFNRAMVDRELRMIELKKEVNELCARASQPPRYPNNLG
jgi:PAS domain S-box-containing protein